MNRRTYVVAVPAALFSFGVPRASPAFGQTVAGRIVRAASLRKTPTT